MSRPDLSVTFHVDPADRSVGIMSEGFSAWDASPEATAWCEIELLPGGAACFRWYDNETGAHVSAPDNSILVERALQGFADAYYIQESYDGTPESDPEPARACCADCCDGPVLDGEGRETGQHVCDRETCSCHARAS